MLHLQPTHVEKELQERKEREVHVAVLTILQKLSPHETGQEKHINGKSHNLHTKHLSNYEAFK